MLPAPPPLPSPIPDLAALNLPRADLAVLLGSGLGALFDRPDGPRLTARRDVPYAELPGLARPGAPGHPGALSRGRLGAVRVAIFRGRLHLYEGFSAREAAAPVALAAALGAHTLVVTNAAGGLNPEFRTGDLVLIEDHLNIPGLAGQNPLTGRADFVALDGAYDPDLRERAVAAAAAEDLPLRRGVYAMVAGPSYETPAETRFLRAVGADLVGMSTANEVVLARRLGLRVLGISVVTNELAGGPPRPAGAEHRPAGADLPTHDAVLTTGARAVPALERLLLALLPDLAACA
jgi:purine-nucleoside phosphorylase